jgi:prefoldin subunit 5
MSIATVTRKAIDELEALTIKMEEALEKAQSSYDDKSEKWQESDKGQFTQEQIEAFDSALDNVRTAFDSFQEIQLEFEE